MSSTLLIALYIACELIANITANKTITLLGMSAPGGVFIYAVTFTLIDLVNEHFGKEGARRVIYAAFAPTFSLRFTRRSSLRFLLRRSSPGRTPSRMSWARHRAS